MRTCKKCHEQFSTGAWIDGKYRNLGNRRYCSNCSPFGARNTRKLEPQPGIECVCKYCQRVYIYRRSSGATQDICNSCQQRIRHHRVKRRAVEYLGGRCSQCGYNKSIFAMDFHHVGGGKDFNISAYYNLSWSKLKEELDKCVLLCANCHREIENEEIVGL